MELQNRRDLIIKGFESAKNAVYISHEYIAFRLGLYLAQTEAFDAIAQRPGKDAKRNSFAPDAAVLQRFFKCLSASPIENPPVIDTLKKLEGYSEILPELVEAAQLGDLDTIKRFSSDTGIDPDMLLFLGRAGAAPFASRTALAGNRTLLRADGDAGSCPYCGAAPGLSLLRGESGRRFLICSVCGMEREFPRLKCPFCAREGDLEIIRESEDAPRWIETCGSCRRYLNATDTRKLGLDAECIPLIETISNLYLDLIAEEYGCRRNLPYVAIS